MRFLAALVACAACALSYAQSPAPESSLTPPAQAQRNRDAQRDADAPSNPAMNERGGPRSFTVTWKAPEPLKGLFEKFLPPPKPEEGEHRRGYVRPWIRDARKKVPDIAAAEGYFNATLEVDFDDEEHDHITATVTPGPRATVGEVRISFTGDLGTESPEHGKRREQLLQGWGLQRGSVFRSADWEVAKTRIVEATASRDYAAARIESSAAKVDADASTASLQLVIDSGPPFTLGDVVVQGLEEYPEAVVRRVVRLKPGDRFDSDRLTELQRAIQNGPWFSSVIVDVDRDPEHPALVPVKVTVAERPRFDLALSVGYGTDDGARTEAGFRYRDLLGRGLDLQTSLRAAQTRQIGYADVYLPPGLATFPGRGSIPYQDSFGVLAEHSVVERLAASRFAIAGYRHFRLERWETQVGLTYQVERSYPEGADPAITRALAPVVAWTWRRVDDLYDPKRGGVLNIQVSAAKKSIASAQDFVRLYGQYQHWVPITPRDQLLLRTEWGTTIAPSRAGIPEDFLFRAGGSRSNRGYAYQSLGVTEGSAVVGGRYLATGTAEGIHWLDDSWGAALFVDVGDAADKRGDWQANPSYGVGARYRTPAGPFALDLAYAQDAKRLRLSFSVTVAF